MARFRAVVSLLALGCGRLGFEAAGSDAGSVDAALDASGPDAAPLRLPWDGPFTMEPPEPVVELNTMDYESECFFLDGQTLLFSSSRPGGAGGFDIYSATRVGETFTEIVELALIDSPDLDGRLVTADGLVGYFHSDRDGGVGLSDIWMVTRANASEPFRSENASALLDQSTGGADFDPWPSVDGLRLYYVVPDLAGAPGAQDIVVARRDSIDDPFGPPELVGGINLESNEDNPALSPDETFIVFGSDRDGGMGEKDLWFARRADRDAAFAAPEPMPVVNSPEFDWEVCFNLDELYFSSTRPGGLGGNDIYRSRFVPL